MRVALTHARGRFEALPEALGRAGLTAIEAPLLSTRPRAGTELRASAEALLDLPWLLVTSRSTVEAWAALGLPWQRAGRPRIGAVGPGTAAALEAAGARPTLVAEPATAAGLAEAFCARRDAAGPVGLPQGNRARPGLARALAGAGFEPRTLVVYDSLTLPWPEGVAADLVVLASPSAARALPEAVGAALGARARLVAIGPATARAIHARGWRCRRATEPTPAAIVAAVRSALERGPRRDPAPAGDERARTPGERGGDANPRATSAPPPSGPAAAVRPKDDERTDA